MMDPMESIEEVLMVPAEDIEHLRESSKRHGVDLSESKPLGIEPVGTIAVVLVGGVLAVNAVSRLLEERKGGQVIDMRPSATRTVFRSRDVQYGLIVVLASDGTVTVRATDPQNGLSSVIESLRGLATGEGGANIDTVEQAVRRQLGPDAEISAQSTQNHSPMDRRDHGGH